MVFSLSKYIVPLKPMKTYFAFSFFLISFIAFGQQDRVSKDLKVNAHINGTLLQPKTPTENLVIIIPGSGPTDRNGNQQLTRSDALKKLAEALVDQNIASFRYDKKVLTLLNENALQEEKLRFEEFIEDAITTVTFFRKKSSYRNIYIVGHSQGSLVGMIAAQQSDVQGFVSLAGAGQSIDQTILSQIALQMPRLEESTKNAFNTLKEKGKVKDYNPALESILRPDTQAFMSSWMNYDPTEEIKKIKVPVLIIAGSKNIQASEKEFKSLQAAKPDAKAVLIDKMNHVLRRIEGTDLENSKSYNEPLRPIMPELIDAITAFING